MSLLKTRFPVVRRMRVVVQSTTLFVVEDVVPPPEDNVLPIKEYGDGSTDGDICAGVYVLERICLS